MLDRALAALGIVYLALVYAFIFVPLVLVVLISFSADSYLTFPPAGWSMRWYVELLGNREFVAAALNSLMAVLGPIVGPGLLTLVAELPRGDWRIGAPFLFCAALQALALVFAVRYARTHTPTVVNAHA